MSQHNLTAGLGFVLLSRHKHDSSQGRASLEISKATKVFPMFAWFNSARSGPAVMRSAPCGLEDLPHHEVNLHHDY